MPDEIPPVLGAQEWAQLEAGRYNAYDLLVRWEPQDLPKVIALANHDRPDGDPGKLTREDLEAVGRAAGAFEYPDQYEALTPEDRVVLWTALGRVYAKLAALLPPRPEVPRE